MRAAIRSTGERLVDIGLTFLVLCALVAGAGPRHRQGPQGQMRVDTTLGGDLFPPSVGAKLPRQLIVRHLDRDDVIEARLKGGIVDGYDRLYTTIEIARHQV